jgi:hypothetical protein
MTNPGDPAYSKIAQLMQQNLREVGMHARIQQVAVPDFIDRVWTKGQFEVVTSWMAGFTDPGMVPLWWNPEDRRLEPGLLRERAGDERRARQADGRSDRSPARRRAGRGVPPHR